MRHTLMALGALVGLVLSSGYGHQASAKDKAASAAESSFAVIEFEQFLAMSMAQKVAYIGVLREAMEIIEAEQVKYGTKYETAEYQKLERLMRGLLAEVGGQAEAQTERKEGATCTYAGGFSTYKPGGRFCRNNRPCPGRSGQIECNPLLYGPGICTSTADGATARCSALFRDSNRRDEDLAAELSKPEKFKEWGEFKTTFNSFCNPILEKPDLHRAACRRIKERVDALDPKVKPPAPPPVAAPAPAPAPVAPPEPIRLEEQPVQTIACTPGAVIGCQVCPNTAKRKVPREQKHVSSRPSTKYQQLIRVMAKNCSLVDKSDESYVRPRTELNLMNKFGECRSIEYAGTLNDLPERIEGRKTREAVADLIAGKDEAHKGVVGLGRDVSAGSLGMEQYFGLSSKEARKIFCSDGDVSKNLSILDGLPDRSLLYGGEGPMIDEIRKYLEDGLPLSDNKNFPQGPGTKNTPEERETLVGMKRQWFQRQALKRCLGEQSRASSQERMSVEETVSVKTCELHSVHAPQNLALAALQSFVQRHGSLPPPPASNTYCAGPVVGNPGQINRRCDPANLAGTCGPQMVQADAQGMIRISVLKCGPQGASLAPAAGGTGAGGTQ